MSYALFTLLSYDSTFLFPVYATTECIGPKNASKFMVYLHGMDTVSPSLQEVENRSVLQKLANNLNIRFALPRAVDKCPPNSKQICWTWAAKTSEDIKSVKAAINSAVEVCFSKKEYKVLGFSNGGAAVKALLRLCEKVDFNTAIAIGSAGGWYSSDPKNLESCKPKVTFLLGSEDQPNQKPIREFVSHLVSLRAPVFLVEYKGGHRLMYEPLFNLLK